MGQAQVRTKGRAAIYVMVVLAVAAILLFSLLTAFYYWQAQDYRDAKYKAQYILVQDVLDTIPMAEENITDAVDDLLDTGWRRAATMSLTGLAQSLSSTCNAIQVMYPADDERHGVFGNLTLAFAALSQCAYEAYIELSTVVGPDEGHDLEVETDAELGTALSILGEISDEFGVSVDPDTDWVEDPYDLVDRMDLGVLDNLANQLLQTF